MINLSLIDFLLIFVLVLLTNLMSLGSIPHSGYHWDSIAKNYFEGWYYRLTLPEIGQNFAFMYSIEDPLGEQPNSGGAVQILGIDDKYLCRSFPDVNRFWAAKNSLSLGHWGKTNLSIKPQLLPQTEFFTQIKEGYQATATLNQGCIRLPNGDRCCWEYQIEPIYGWGNPQRPQRASAGWLSYLPIFDPGWQILIAHGLATGWVEWQSKLYKFKDAPAYSEKNWGTSFPIKWFWINCNSFKHEPDLAITAGGGIRKVFWWQETVGLIAIHHRGKFYEFAPWNSRVSWQVQPWGFWQMEAVNRDWQITLTGNTDLPGNYVRTPTAKGLVFNCRDTTKGKLTLELKSHNDRIILQADSNLAGLEIGGFSGNSQWRIN
jgi:tocopherol cyclase